MQIVSFGKRRAFSVGRASGKRQFGRRRPQIVGVVRRRRRNIRTAGFLGIETKFYDTFLVAAALTSPTDASGGEHDPSATIVLNSVTQGDGESQRDGRKINMKSISINGVVFQAAQANQTAVDFYPTVYIALVLDSQTNGATIASENVFCNPSANAGGAANVYRNLQYSRRFKVLRSLTITPPQGQPVYDGTNIEVSGTTTPWRMDVKLPNIPVTYTGTTESVANITDNSLHVVAYTNGTDSGVGITYNARLRFVG